MLRKPSGRVRVAVHGLRVLGLGLALASLSLHDEWVSGTRIAEPVLFSYAWGPTPTRRGSTRASSLAAAAGAPRRRHRGRARRGDSRQAWPAGPGHSSGRADGPRRWRRARDPFVPARRANNDTSGPRAAERRAENRRRHRPGLAALSRARHPRLRSPDAKLADARAPGRAAVRRPRDAGQPVGGRLLARTAAPAGADVHARSGRPENRHRARHRGGRGRARSARGRVRRSGSGTAIGRRRRGCDHHGGIECRRRQHRRGRIRSAGDGGHRAHGANGRDGRQPTARPVDLVPVDGPHESARRPRRPQGAPVFLGRAADSSEPRGSLPFGHQRSESGQRQHLRRGCTGAGYRPLAGAVPSDARPLGPQQPVPTGLRGELAPGDAGRRDELGNGGRRTAGRHAERAADACRRDQRHAHRQYERPRARPRGSSDGRSRQLLRNRLHTAGRRRPTDTFDRSR